MNFDRGNLSNETLIEFYKKLLLPRMIEEKMLVLLRQGKISKWFSGIGQEAIAVGSTLASKDDEWVMPLHRNLGVFTTRNMPLYKLFMQWQGNKEGYSKGRERSFHFGSREHFICGMISHLGPQLAVAAGAALAYKLQKNNKVSIAYTGDGGTSEGDFHEALNTAAVWNLPVIFIIENNGYALSTPITEQYTCDSLIQKAVGYGMHGKRIDGNNILEVYHTIAEAKKYCSEQQKPFLLECMTFRMRGHEEASGVKYVPGELFEKWEKKDPVKNYQHYLLENNILSVHGIENIRGEIKNYIDGELAIAYKAEKIVPNTAAELVDVYQPININNLPKQLNNTSATFTFLNNTPELKFIQAISEGLDIAMTKHPNLILMGQDIAEYGGAFKVTEGFLRKFGNERVRNTPLCESAIVGAGLGLSLENYKSVIEMQFADFVSAGFNQIVNNLAKIHYRWGQNADVVIRMPTGGGVGAGPFHSQSNEAWFTHIPGLKVVYPATPADAKGLLLAAINDPNPVMYFEHKALYRSITGPVPEGIYEVPIGKAKVVQTGADFTIITYGMGVHWAQQYINQNPQQSIYLIDLRTLTPLDYEAIDEAVKATGKVLILHEDTLVGGIGGELSAYISENLFKYLDAPIMRCAGLDTPIPFNTDLEKNFMANSRLANIAQKLITY